MIEYILERGFWHPIYNGLCNLPTLVLDTNMSVGYLYYLLFHPFVKRIKKLLQRLLFCMSLDYPQLLQY